MSIEFRLERLENKVAALVEVLKKQVSVLSNLIQGVSKMAADLTALQAAVDSLATVVGTAVVDLQALMADVQTLMNQPTVDQAALQAIADRINGITQSLGNAVATNQPPAAPAALKKP